MRPSSIKIFSDKVKEEENEKNKKTGQISVLESNTPGDIDDFELWDHGQMLRSAAEQNSTIYRWGKVKPASCIPITIIFVLIVLVVLLPLVDNNAEKTYSNKTYSTLCSNECRIQLVESIPEGLVFPSGSPSFLSTYDAWKFLIKSATTSISIGSFYWSLRSSDVYKHPSSWQGEDIFQDLLAAGVDRKIKIRIAQSEPTQPSTDTQYLEKRKAAEVRSVNFPRLIGGGVLHTKLWVVDGSHIYIGSANMDWRSLTQVKELGTLITNCSCLANDVNKMFEMYWELGTNDSVIPLKWPSKYNTDINEDNPTLVNFNDDNNGFLTYFANAPPQLCPKSRTQDLEAIVNVISKADKFIHISVMDFLPLTLYTPKVQFWPVIDNALRKAAIENLVSVKLLISYWNHSRESEDYFLRSLEALSHSIKGVDIQIKRFIVPASADQQKIPFARVNHNKYMVTDETAYIGTSNWSGDYFISTAGIGLIMSDHRPHNRNATQSIDVRTDLANIFMRDWNSQYAVDLIR